MANGLINTVAMINLVINHYTKEAMKKCNFNNNTVYTSRKVKEHNALIYNPKLFQLDQSK